MQKLDKILVNFINVTIIVEKNGLANPYSNKVF